MAFIYGVYSYKNHNYKSLIFFVNKNKGDSKKISSANIGP